MKTRQPPGIEPGTSDLAVSALPPELWPPGDSQPSQFSISPRMCRPERAGCSGVSSRKLGNRMCEWFPTCVSAELHVYVQASSISPGFDIQSNLSHSLPI